LRSAFFEEQHQGHHLLRVFECEVLAAFSRRIGALHPLGVRNAGAHRTPPSSENVTASRNRGLLGASSHRCFVGSSLLRGLFSCASFSVSNTAGRLAWFAAEAALRRMRA